MARCLIFMLLFLASSTVGLPVEPPAELLQLGGGDVLGGRHSVDASDIAEASRDFGGLTTRAAEAEPPVAVFQPRVAGDVAGLVRAAFGSARGFRVSARGHGHSISGQEQAPGGVVVVVDMSHGPGAAARARALPVYSPALGGYYVDVWDGELWVDVLNWTLAHGGLAPRSWTDYLYLSVGGILSNAGIISRQAFHHGPQIISNVYELDVVVTAMVAGACNATHTECATPVFAVVPDAELFRYDGDHDVLLNVWCHKCTYENEQATGLASQSLLINGAGAGGFKYRSAMAACACSNATHTERATPVFAVVPGKTYMFCIAGVTSLSALNFEVEFEYGIWCVDLKDHSARLIGYLAPAVASCATSSRRPPMSFQQYAAAFVLLMLLARLYAATGRPVADQNLATAGGTIAMSAPAPSASGSGHAPAPSSGDPAGTGSSNPSGTLSTAPSSEEPSSPPRSPPSVGAPDNEGQQVSTFLLGFLALGFAIMVGILIQGFECILGGWSRQTKVVYKASTWLGTVFLALAVLFLAAWYRACPMTRNRKLLLWISELCAELGVVLYIDLLVVIIPCKLGRGACVAAMPSVAAISLLIATVRMWGPIVVHILAGPRRQTQAQLVAGDGMV